MSTTETERKLRVITGTALSEAIAELGELVQPSSTFALLAIVWKSLPPEAVDGIVHHAAVKLGPVEHREVFAAYTSTWETGSTVQEVDR